MRKSKRSGRILHLKRDISTRGFMHAIFKVKRGVISLRDPRVMAKIDELIARLTAHGVTFYVGAILETHGHLGVRPSSRAAMGAAMRMFMRELGKFLKKLSGLKGPGGVFEDRYFSKSARSVKHIWHTLSYVLRNPKDARILLGPGQVDPCLRADVEAVAHDRLLSGIFGHTPDAVRALFVRFTQKSLPYRSLRERSQLSLPFT